MNKRSPKDTYRLFYLNKKTSNINATETPHEERYKIKNIKPNFLDIKEYLLPHPSFPKFKIK